MLINCINTKYILELMNLKEFSIDCLYMYIRVKAAKDEGFLEWFDAYNFNILYICIIMINV